MPGPTKEQFDAAAKKVMETAPPGLSREEFFDLIDKQLQGFKGDPVEQPSAAGMGRNAVDSTINLVAGAGKGLFKLATQNPIQSAKDLASGVTGRVKEYANDVDPKSAFIKLKSGDVTGALGTILPVGVAYRDPAGVAADTMIGYDALKGVGKIGLKALRREPPSPGFPPINPTQQRYVVDRYMPNKSGYSLEESGTHAPSPEYVPVGGEGGFNSTRPTTPLKDPQEAIYDALREKLGGKASDTPMADELYQYYHGKGTPEPRWHSGAEPGSEDARRVSNLHKSEAELDADYKRRLWDDKGKMVPNLFPLLVKWGILKGIPMAAEPAANVGAYTRFLDSQ